MAGDAPGSTPASASREPALSLETSDGAARQIIRLGRGFRPEGIAADEDTAYVGSRGRGRIVALDLQDGTRSRVTRGDGTPALGLHLDFAGRLWVAGGDDGDLSVLDPRSGKVLKRYQLGGRGSSFINDVVVTRRGAFVTDSQKARIFVVPLRGSLPVRRNVRQVALGGEWEQAGAFGANGIVTSPQGGVLVVNTTTGALYRVPVDPDGESEPGDSVEVDLGGADLSNADGMLREGRALYVVRSLDNTVTELFLDESSTSAAWVRELDSPEFDTPTTIALIDEVFLLPNARFGVRRPAKANYEVVLVPQP